jgi:hypothetical protein
VALSAGAAVALTLLRAPPPLLAQLSPGDLSQAHAALEGSGHCLDCHQPGRGVAPARCLACHTALRDRIGAGRGLHARDDHRACERCHVEHQGRGFELIFWGDEGRERFDHARTGFPLQGRHGTLRCTGCHSRARLRDPEALDEAGADPDRTFLGLPTACGDCHSDPHGGQFAPRTCAECHGQDRWTPVASFDHEHTAFPLTGRHRSVACDRCHPRGDRRAVRGASRFKGVPFASCADCHRDPHAGRLGPQCSSCHATAGWNQGATERFDHDRTRYPLRGRHRQVACDSCHRGGRTTRLPFDRCTDCHADRHAGQLARRADGGRCESCHDVEGFLPARFGTEDHEAAWPLTGSHLAVPCDSCHRDVLVDRLRAAGLARGGGGSRTTEQLRFASTACASCHRDPHAGRTDRVAGAAGCAACHVTDGWHDVAFDHARTRFPLTAAHARIACVRCHPGTVGEIAFTGRPTTCDGCHADPHAGQFARAGTTACTRCHAEDAWRIAAFDHDRATAFPLEGAHRRVACAACHRMETAGGKDVVRYRPLGTTCADCHEGARP